MDHAAAPAATAIRTIGLVVHQQRDLDEALRGVRGWASAHGAQVGQVPVPGLSRRVADPVPAEDCDLLVAVGGDGTALVALRAGAAAGRPVLGIACGSIGALMSVRAGRVPWALDQVAAGAWTPVAVPGLEVEWDGGRAVAVNDLVVVRGGPGQVMVTIDVDGVRYATVSGDGLITATPLGSTAYTISAGGPILAPGVEGIVLTPISPHGGSCPPLVASPASALTLTVDPGFGGVRHEIDGRPVEVGGRRLRVRWLAGHATLVSLAGEEHRLTGLRRRGIVIDSPRAVVRVARENQERAEPPT